MERYYSTGQSPQRAVAPTEEEEEEGKKKKKKKKKKERRRRRRFRYHADENLPLLRFLNQINPSYSSGSRFKSYPIHLVF
jgi:hypothetical protein